MCNRLWSLGLIGFLVIDGSYCIWLVGKGAAHVRSHEDSRVGCHVGFDYYIGALADTKGDHICLEWYDGHIVLCDDGHVVVVNREALQAFGACIDQPQAMSLAAGEFEFGYPGIGCTAGAARWDCAAVKVHLAVDEVVVGDSRRLTHCNRLFDEVEVRRMVPVGQQYWSDVYIIEDVLMRTVDDHGAKETSCILGAIVGMIPRRAEEICLERIRERFAWSNGTLLHGRDTVEPRSSSLEDAMPMQSSPFLRPGNLVVNGDLEGITPVGFKGRSRELVVDQDDASIDAIRRNVATRDGEVVRTNDACERVSLLLDLRRVGHGTYQSLASSHTGSF